MPTPSTPSTPATSATTDDSSELFNNLTTSDICIDTELTKLISLSNISFIHIGLGDDAPPEIKKPRKPSLFDIGNLIPARSIVSIICGGMHTVALTNTGIVYTWGCNDEGALGREGPENTPL